jgi:pimeloyl-ACP methyl ester carboxylesterase
MTGSAPSGQRLRSFCLPFRQIRSARQHSRFQIRCLGRLLILACLAWPTVTAADDSKSPQQINLETSDGIALNMAYYPGPEKPVATIMLVHDIGGSEASVRVLAAGLQKAGCAVAVPDLRGHGGSTSGSRELPLENLRTADLRMIAASGGGVIRQQAAVSGDLETVYRWLKEQEETGEVNLDRFCVIGSGLGGTLASLWVAVDWSWQPNTRGPQGQNVKALVLISPEWMNKGISIAPALMARAVSNRRMTQPVLETLPILIIAGKNESSADRIFQRIKAARPMSWYKQSASGDKAKADKKDTRAPETGPLVYTQINSPLRADKLASLPSGNQTPLALACWFLAEAASP